MGKLPLSALERLDRIDELERALHESYHTIGELRGETERLVAALQIARDALAHSAPEDCWATGPMLGDIMADLVVCPGCAALARIDAAIAAGKGPPMEPTDELFPVVKMPPHKSYQVEISTPGRIAALEAEVERLKELNEHPLPGPPHDGPNDCPTWYDYCRCTVENLQFNIERAEKSEAEVERLREALAVYASEANWVYASFIGPGMGPGPWLDGGDSARTALEPQP